MNLKYNDKHEINEKYTVSCPNCWASMHMNLSCASCGNGYCWPLKISWLKEKTKDQINDSIYCEPKKTFSLPFADTRYKSRINILNISQKKHTIEFQLEIFHPCRKMNNNRNFRKIGFKEDTRQSYFKRIDNIKPKYYCIIIEKDLYSLHEWKTRKSKTISEIPYLNISLLMEKLRYQTT